MEKSRQIYCRWKRLGRTLAKETRTAIEQNVAFMKLNGAQDINNPHFSTISAPKKGFRILVSHH
jgi:hypothetical protein